MNIRALEARLHVLNAAKAELESKREASEEAIDVRRYDDSLIEVGGQIKEVEQWLESYDDDPRWGEYFKEADGQRIPRLPTFASKEEREARMASPSGDKPGWTEEDVKRARESNAIESARSSAMWLDGKSPYIDEHS